MASELEADLRRIRALCASLSSVVNSLWGLEENSEALASCVFLMTELSDQINETEVKFLSSGEATTERDILTKALEFYADGDNHQAAPGKLSRVVKDKGRKARAAFEKRAGLEDLDENEEDEEDE